MEKVERKRLTTPQIRLLERAMVGAWLRGSSEHQLAERLYPLGLIRQVYEHTPSKIQTTHDGAIALKQNGYYPADPSLRDSVRDPAEGT